MENFEKYLILKVSKDISSMYIKEVREKAINGLKDYKYGVIMDLKEVKFISSEFLGLFFKLTGEAEKINKKFCICNMASEAYKIFVLSGFNRHLMIEQTLDDAIRAMQEN